MSATTPSILTSLPWAQFRRYRAFYLWYDAFYALLATAAIATMVGSGFQGLMPSFEIWHVALLPAALYVLIMAHVFIHNASHGNFPKPINRIVGEICGWLVLTRFASWEIVHRRHHRYSDDPERDPHPAARGYWRYAKDTLINVERQLQQQYLDVYGDTPENRRHEKIRSVWSFVSGSLVTAFFFFLLGPSGFFVLFLPASVGAALFVIHFNWCGHNAHTKDGAIEPTNLDHGWYWLGNRMFFGIYYHGNHHKMARVFNPRKMPIRAPRAAVDEPEEARVAA